jgi:hypothetical protein
VPELPPSAATKPGTFRLVSGEDQIRRWDAGDGNDKAFCGTRGSALFSLSPDDREIIFVPLGSLDGDPGVRASGRVHAASAAVWEPFPMSAWFGFPGRLKSRPTGMASGS